MSFEHPTLAIRKGDSLNEVQEKLGLTRAPGSLPEFDEPVRFYHLPEVGFWVFFNEADKAYSLRFEDPFPYLIEGLRIGDTREDVLKVRGKPDRHFPVPDNKERWLYDEPQFLRVDFDPETNRVEKILR